MKIHRDDRLQIDKTSDMRLQIRVGSNNRSFRKVKQITFLVLPSSSGDLKVANYKLISSISKNFINFFFTSLKLSVILPAKYCI